MDQLQPIHQSFQVSVTLLSCHEVGKLSNLDFHPESNYGKPPASFPLEQDILQSNAKMIHHPLHRVCKEDLYPGIFGVHDILTNYVHMLYVILDLYL